MRASEGRASARRNGPNHQIVENVGARFSGELKPRPSETRHNTFHQPSSLLRLTGEADCWSRPKPSASLSRYRAVVKKEIHFIQNKQTIQSIQTKQTEQKIQKEQTRQFIQSILLYILDICVEPLTFPIVGVRLAVPRVPVPAAGRRVRQAVPLQHDRSCDKTLGRPK